MATVRPTKKQRELLTYIEQFIGQHGYSPSYREIMNGLDYTSVATVALHINNLISRGHLRKRDHSARSLEVVSGTHATDTPDESPKQTAESPIKPGEERWLVDKVEAFLATAEQAEEVTAAEVDKLLTLVSALHVLGLEGAAQSFNARLAGIKQQVQE